MDYMRRAGELKKALHPGEEASTSSSASVSSSSLPSLSSEQRSPSQVLHARSSVEADQFQELLQLSHMTPKLATGLEIARAAEEYELEAQFVVALEKYQVGQFRCGVEGTAIDRLVAIDKGPSIREKCPFDHATPSMVYKGHLYKGQLLRV